MRKYEVFIPENVSELKDLEGKIIRVFYDRPENNSIDYKLIFSVNSNNLELISQGTFQSSLVGNDVIQLDKLRLLEAIFIYLKEKEF